MASTDFSVRKYTYDDSPNDFFLLNFTLAAEDIHLKVLVIISETLLMHDFLS